MTQFEIQQASKEGKPKWVRSPDSLWRRFKLAAALAGMTSLQEWILTALVEKVERQEKTVGRKIEVMGDED